MARAQKFTPTSSWAQGTDASAGTTANVNPVTSNPRSRNTFFCPSAGPSRDYSRALVYMGPADEKDATRVEVPRSSAWSSKSSSAASSRSGSSH